MAAPTPQQPLSPEQRLAVEQQAKYQRYKKNLAICGLVACPVIALLPPRKLDLYTLSLGLGFYFSANHLYTTHLGRPLLPNAGWESLPTDRAREMQKIIREEREKGRKTLDKQNPAEKSLLGKIWMGDEESGWKERRLEEERKALEEGKSYTDMIFEQIWEVWNWDKKKGKQDDQSKKD